jgi:hypothetical protein
LQDLLEREGIQAMVLEKRQEWQVLQQWTNMFMPEVYARHGKVPSAENLLFALSQAMFRN